MHLHLTRALIIIAGSIFFSLVFATFDVVLGGKLDVLLEIFDLEIHNAICDFANI